MKKPLFYKDLFKQELGEGPISLNTYIFLFLDYESSVGISRHGLPAGHQAAGIGINQTGGHRYSVSKA